MDRTARPSDAPRVVIAGVPRAGKTTLAKRMRPDLPHVHTDDYKHLPWSDVPDAILRDLRALEDGWVLEGVQSLRVLRRALDNDIDLGVTRLVYLRTPHEELTPGQRRMAAGLETIWRGVRPRLRGVIVSTRA